MPKAIKITADNKSMLEADYTLDDEELDGSEGLYLVVDFGAVFVYPGILNSVALDHAFVKGEDIENGWFEVTRR